jgi:hypothetical protein
MPDSLALLAGLALYGVGALGCAALTGSRRTAKLGRLAGLLMLVSGLLVPPEHAGVRVGLAALGILGFGRSLDLARRSGGLSFAGRVWMMVALFDVRELERAPPRFDRREAAWLLAHLLAFAGAFVLAFELAPTLAGVGSWLLRWSAGLVTCYALTESIHSVLWLGYRGLGLKLPRVNDYPIVSTTLAEFWGRRWNRAVSGWLNDNLFFPLARRRKPELGILAAFAGSTALHFWFAWVPLDLGAGLMMAGYFVVHAAAMLLERSLGVSLWPPALRRSWSWAWVVLPSPLFIEPALQLLAAFRA